jgi:hypothetical protein
MARHEALQPLGENGALGRDGLQWILYRRAGAAVPGGPLRGNWQAVSYIRSNKEILLRCIREKGIELDVLGVATIEAFPSSFGEPDPVSNVSKTDLEAAAP